MKNKFTLVKTLLVFLGSVASFLLSSVLHGNGSLGSSVVTVNELSRLSGMASIPVNDTIGAVLVILSRVLFFFGLFFAYLTLRYIFKFILPIKFVKNFLNKLSGGK